ncbi:hypothetical protein PMAYCL1PPCAC_03150, partial [Pristionchus mayeri]
IKIFQGCKSTANVKEMTALFKRYSVGAVELEWKAIIIEKILRNREQGLLIQPNILTVKGEPTLVNYPETAEGAIQSVLQRFSRESMADFEVQWRIEQD